MAQKWQLKDTVTGETYTFQISPVESGSPAYNAAMDYVTEGPDGLMAKRGQIEQLVMEFTGTLITQDQYTALYNWYSKSVPVQVTDALNRTFTIYFTAWTPTRKASPSYPWRHSYTAQALILDGA